MTAKSSKPPLIAEEYVCPKTGRRFQRIKKVTFWQKWLLPLMGLGSLLWFLLRVLPKPSRAAYPCMRVAAPFASGFVLWLLGLSAMLLLRRAIVNAYRARYALAGLCLLASLVIGWITLVRAPLSKAQAFVPPEGVSSPIGVGKGIHPGRVSWVWDPDATQGEVYWDCSTGYWWDEDHNNQAVIDAMMGKTIRALVGVTDDAEAWNALFEYYNSTHGRGNRGYLPGDKIAIKVNLNTSLDWYYPGWDGIDLVYDPAIYSRDYDNDPDMTPQTIRALLRQLTGPGNVPQEDIYIGDPVRYWNDKFWDRLRAEFPYVHFMDVQGYLGREQVIASDDPVIHYSKLNSAGQPVSDHLPTYYLDAAYMINFAIFKKNHIGITVCGKNHFGSLCRNPVHVHEFIYREDTGYQEMGDYNPFVDYMGHPDMGGKTFLYLVDGLWGGWLYGAEPISMPRKWNIPPFNNDFPSSLFASQDPVAIDSVALDFFSAEDDPVLPLVPGSDNYLHEAALIPNAPSGIDYDPDGDGDPLTASLGVHEHWNSYIEKKYSRNLGFDYGIELVTGEPEPPLTAVRLRGNLASPIYKGTNVTLSATPTGGRLPQYQFWVRIPGSSAKSLLRDYSIANTCAWTPAIPGTYTLLVYAREKGSGAPYQVYHAVSYVVKAPPLSAVFLSGNPSSPIYTGTDVTLSATPTGGRQPEYQFWVRIPGSSAKSLLCDYNNDNTCPWTPAIAGTYTLLVYAREKGSGAPYQVYHAVTYKVKIPPLSAVSLSGNPTSPVDTGVNVTLTATPTGGQLPQYQFWVRAPGSSAKSLLRDYSIDSTCLWTPAVPGKYTLLVYAREMGSGAPYQVYQPIQYQVE